MSLTRRSLLALLPFVPAVAKAAVASVFGRSNRPAIWLVETCSACPEQYDAFNSSGELVGYLRLRHGHFIVRCPDVGGELVYESNTEGDGCFTTGEQARELSAAVAAIERWTKG